MELPMPKVKQRVVGQARVKHGVSPTVSMINIVTHRNGTTLEDLKLVSLVSWE
jgi:hypothetical protein